MTEPTGEQVKAIVFYSALVKAVELYLDGRMHQGDASTLASGGWSYRIDNSESFRAIATANILAARLESVPESQQLTEAGICYAVGEEGECCLYDARQRVRFWQKRVGIPRNEVQRRMEEDERIFSVTDPADLMEMPPWDTADTEESDPYWHQKDEYVRRECAKAHKEIALREAKDKERV